MKQTGEAERENLKSDDATIALVLFVAAAALRLFRLGHWYPLPDEISYALTASRLVAGHTFATTDITFFPPLFVYLAALLQSVGIEMLLSVRLTSAIFGALLIPFIYLLSRLITSRLNSLVVASSTMLLFTPALYSRLGQVEAAFIFFLVLSVYLLLLGVARNRPHLLFFCGLSLGLALWTKEVALGALASMLLFLLFFRPIRWRLLIALGSGWLVLAVPLFALGAATGNNILFEVSQRRGYDINMLSLPLPASVAAVAANTLLNLFPRVFSAAELLIFATAGSAFILTAGWIAVRRLFKGDLLARYLLCYAIVHLPFFVLFSRKFFYYLLPTALLLFIAATAGSLAEISRRQRHPALLTLVLAGVTLLFNIYACRYLYLNRGNHQTFALSISRIPAGDTLLTSHPDLLNYLNQRCQTNLTILPLFLPGSYDIDSTRCADPTVSAVLLKASYYDRLTARNPGTWAWLQQVYPHRHSEIDPDWSFPPNQHLPPAFARIAAGLTRPVGTVLLSR